MKRTVIILGLLAFSTMAHALSVEPRAETTMLASNRQFFQPSVEDYNTSWREIGVQQEAYKQSRHAGQRIVDTLVNAGNVTEAAGVTYKQARDEWRMTLEFTLFHFQRGWVLNDIGFSYLQEAGGTSRMTLTQCSDAVEYFDAAIAEFKKRIPRFASNAADGIEKATRSRRHVLNRILVLELE